MAGVKTGVSGSVTIPHAVFGMFNGTQDGEIPPNPGNPRTVFNEPDDVLHLAKWTGSFDRETLDISNWGSVSSPDNSNVREKIGAMLHFNGSAEGFLPSDVSFDFDPHFPTSGDSDRKSGIASPDAVGVAGFILKYFEAGPTDRTIEFTGLMSGWTTSPLKEGLIGYSFNFVSSSVLSMN